MAEISGTIGQFFSSFGKYICACQNFGFPTIKMNNYLQSFLYILFAFSCVSTVTKGQTYTTNITTLDRQYNLNGISKHRTHLDQFGFFWMTSKYGLDRYDGNEVINVNNLVNINLNNDILEIYESRDTQLWLFTGQHFTGKNTEIKSRSSLSRHGINDIQIVHPISCNILPKEKIFSNAPFDIEDIKTVSSFNFKLYLSLKNADLYEYDNEFIKLGNFPDALLYRRNWCVNERNELVYLDENVIRSIDLKGNPVKTLDTQMQMAALHLTRDGNYQTLGLSTAGTLHGIVLNKDLEIAKIIPQKTSTVPFYTKRKDNNYFKFTNGNLLIETKSGELLFDFKSFFSNQNNDHLQTFETVFLHENTDFAFLRTNSAPHIVHNFVSPFQNFLDTGQDSYSIRGITSAPNGHFLVNGGNRSFLFTPDGAYKTLKHPEKDNLPFLSSEGCFYDAKNNSFWVAYVKDVVEFHLDNKPPTLYHSINNVLLSDVIRLRANGELLVLNQYKSLMRLNEVNKKIEKRIIHAADHPINDLKILKIHEEGDDTYLLTEGHIYQWDVAENKIQPIKSFPEKIKRAQKFDFHFEGLDKIWISTSGDGLFYWDVKKDKLTAYNISNGLSNNIVYSIDQGVDGRMWCSTANGLNAIDLSTNQIDVYLPMDGLSNYEFNSTAHHQDKDGNLYFGGVNGFSKFHPDHISLLQPEDPSTFISNAYIYSNADSLRQEINIEASKHIIFEQDEGFLELKLTAPAVSSQRKTRFQYKFADREDQWRVIEGSNISFSNLNPGTYTLKARAPVTQNSWSKKEATITIKVPTPFFQSKWFYLALASLVCLLGYIYARWRIFNLEKTRMHLEQEVGKRTLTLQRNIEIVKDQAKELKQLDVLKSRFFTNISHELRTPLTLISNPLQQLKKLGLENEKHQLNIETAYAGSQQLKKIVQQILKLADLDANKIKANESLTNVASIVDRIIVPNKSLAASQDIQFRINVAGDQTSSFLVDELKLSEIIQNLILNAFKYTGEGGEVSISIALRDEQLFFSCQDTGVGISKKDLTKVFTKYYQANQTKLPAQGGLGIGLSLSREFARIMKGQLNVESELDKGSTFTLTIPVKIHQGLVEKSTPPAMNAPSDIAQADPNQPTEAKDHLSTILLVEDHEMMLLMLKNTLEPDFNIRTAENGKAGLKILEEKDSTVDLVITDWMMPVMDGPSFLNKLRATASLQRLPVIMLTARASQADKLSILKIGVDDYIIKPFDPEELRSRILNLLSNRRERSQEVDRTAQLSNLEFEVNPSADDRWLEDLKEHVLKNLASPSYSVVELAQAVNLGERQLRRRLKALAGLTPGNYIKECRLLKARHLLENKQMRTVSEVCYAVGFTTPEYFSKIFYQRFGKMPSGYFA